jgi:hypothetical protein
MLVKSIHMIHSRYSQDFTKMCYFKMLSKILGYYERNTKGIEKGLYYAVTQSENSRHCLSTHSCAILIWVVDYDRS